jgi:hypothetical protein
MKTFSQIKEYVEDGGGKNSAANAYKSQTPGQESKVEVKEAKMKDLLRKHKRELQKAQKSGNLELSKKAEEDLMQWAMDAGEIKTDDPDDFTDWLDNNLNDIIKGRIKEDVDLSEAKFNVTKEMKAVRAIDKLLEQAYKGMNKLYSQKNTRALIEVNDGIVEARRGLEKYEKNLKDGSVT